MQYIANAKQSFADVLQSFGKFHRKTLVLETFLNKVAGLKPWNFIEKRLQHRCFPVKFARLFRIALFTDHLRWLLLKMERHFIVFPFFLTMI